MLFLTRPSEDRIRAFLDLQANAPFSYSEVGASRHSAPAGYTIDHNRVRLGYGQQVEARARQFLVRWKMFNLPWVKLCWPDAPLQQGTNVAVLVKHLGFWSLSPARIVYSFEQEGEIRKYGFAYGTLSGHAEIGEERFTIESHSLDNSIWYDLFAFSRPSLLAGLAYPYTRFLQRRFAQQSLIAMSHAANSSI